MQNIELGAPAGLPVQYAVIACSQCRNPWLIELRHTNVACPGCRHRVAVARRTRLWQGDSMNEAQQAVALHRAAFAQDTNIVAAAAIMRMPSPLARHDDPLDAAAAKCKAIRNASARADELGKWLTRLVGQASHDTWLDGLSRAGLDPERAQKELVRMLATDVIFEPRAGFYAHLGSDD
jgi:DNA-directed RNA polymerase subunit RPC12/RpoP